MPRADHHTDVYSADDDRRGHGPTAAGGLDNGAGAASRSLTGVVLNGIYRVDEKIGEGGMGVVYRGTQIALGRPVAVKTILADSQVADAFERFSREARVLSQLQHPNIVQVIDFGSAQPGPVHYLVMEYLSGETLESFVLSRPFLPAEVVYRLAAQIASAVAAAHSKRVVHRDLKPANVFLTTVTGSDTPVVKILDFGLAKAVTTAGNKALTQAGMIMGTLGFSAPEQMQGAADFEPRSDVYSLGAVLYFMLTKDLPYEGDTYQRVLTKQLTESPPPLQRLRPSLANREALDAVIGRAMAQEPANRYQTAGEFLADLDAACHPDGLPRDSQLPSWVAQRSRQNRAAGHAVSRRTLLLGGVAGLTGAGAAGYLWSRRRPAAPANPGATFAGVTADSVTFGISAPFNGPAKELGRGMKLGIEAAFRAAGPVAGRVLKLLDLDDGYEPARTAENVEKLLAEHGVFGFVGCVGTPNAAAALPAVAKAGRVFFAPMTGAKVVRRTPPDRYVFNYRASYAEETARTVEYLVKVRRIEPARIAVFAQADSFGDSGWEGVARALRQEKFDPEQTLRVGYKRNTVDVDEAARAVLARPGRVEAVVMVALYKPAAAFVKRVRDAQPKTIFTNVSFVGSQALLEELQEYGPSVAEGVVVTQVVPHYGSNATAVARYRETLRQHFPSETPGFTSLEGYLAGRVLVEGLERAGGDLTPDTLVDALEKIQELDLGTGRPIRFGPSEHQASHTVWGTAINSKGDGYDELDLE